MTQKRTIETSVCFVLTGGENKLKTVFDPLTSQSCIHPQFVPQEKLCLLRRSRIIAVAGTTHFKPLSCIALDFCIDDVWLSEEFFLLPNNFPSQVIIGACTVRKWRIKLNFEDDKVEVDPKVAKLQLI